MLFVALVLFSFPYSGTFETVEMQAGITVILLAVLQIAFTEEYKERCATRVKTVSVTDEVTEQMSSTSNLFFRVDKRVFSEGTKGTLSVPKELVGCAVYAIQVYYNTSLSSIESLHVEGLINTDIAVGFQLTSEHLYKYTWDTTTWTSFEDYGGTWYWKVIPRWPLTGSVVLTYSFNNEMNQIGSCSRKGFNRLAFKRKLDPINCNKAPQVEDILEPILEPPYEMTSGTYYLDPTIWTYTEYLTIPVDVTVTVLDKPGIIEIGSLILSRESSFQMGTITCPHLSETTIYFDSTNKSKIESEEESRITIVGDEFKSWIAPVSNLSKGGRFVFFDFSDNITNSRGWSRGDRVAITDAGVDGVFTTFIAKVFTNNAIELLDPTEDQFHITEHTEFSISLLSRNIKISVGNYETVSFSRSDTILSNGDHGFFFSGIQTPSMTVITKLSLYLTILEPGEYKLRIRIGISHSNDTIINTINDLSDREEWFLFINVTVSPDSCGSRLRLDLPVNDSAFSHFKKLTELLPKARGDISFLIVVSGLQLGGVGLVDEVGLEPILRIMSSMYNSKLPVMLSAVENVMFMGVEFNDINMGIGSEFSIVESSFWNSSIASTNPISSSINIVGNTMIAGDILAFPLVIFLSTPFMVEVSVSFAYNLLTGGTARAYGNSAIYVTPKSLYYYFEFIGNKIDSTFHHGGLLMPSSFTGGKIKFDSNIFNCRGFSIGLSREEVGHYPRPFLFLNTWVQRGWIIIAYCKHCLVTFDGAILSKKSLIVPTSSPTTFGDSDPPAIVLNNSVIHQSDIRLLRPDSFKLILQNSEFHISDDDYLLIHQPMSSRNNPDSVEKRNSWIRCNSYTDYANITVLNADKVKKPIVIEDSLLEKGQTFFFQLNRTTPQLLLRGLHNFNRVLEDNEMLITLQFIFPPSFNNSEIRLVFLKREKITRTVSFSCQTEGSNSFGYVVGNGTNDPTVDWVWDISSSTLPNEWQVRGIAPAGEEKALLWLRFNYDDDRKVTINDDVPDRSINSFQHLLNADGSTYYVATYNSTISITPPDDVETSPEDVIPISVIVAVVLGVVLVFCLVICGIRRFLKNKLKDISHSEHAVLVSSAETEMNSLKCGEFWSAHSIVGKGSFGVVYEAITNDGATVAVKQIICSRDEARGYQQEFNLIKNLRHPNIIKYLSFESNDFEIFIIMTFYPEGSLSALIEKQSARCLQRNVVRKFTKQILKGVGFLHSHKILHRDIKGVNILISNGVCMLTDFGCLKNWSNTNKPASTVVGTPRWMAPEVIKSGECGYGTKADIWSVGCVVCEMLSGDPPWPLLSSPWEMMYHICNSSPTLKSIVNVDDRNFITLVLNTIPEDRPTVSDLLSHHWISDNSTSSLTNETNQTWRSNTSSDITLS